MRYRIRYYLFLLLAIPLQLAAVDYTVSITTNTCGNVQTYTIPEGEQLVLQAHPIAGYTFAQWLDGNTENPRIVTITSDASYAAEFVAMSPMPTIHNVVASADGCATPKVISVIEGEQILLKAHAKFGYAFSQWSDGNTDNPRAAIINADATFVALFKESDESAPEGQYTITVKADGCTTNLACDIAEGTAVKLYAHPKEYNYFLQWSDGNTDNPRIVIVTEDKEYTAVFDLIKYSVKFVDADGIQIGETQIVNGGENATPPTPPTREGYTFVGWIGTYTNVKSNATIYASYSRNNELSTTQLGSLPGLFSIAPDKQVYFSQGNLQYMGATQTWRFAENQYDTVGIFNNNISSSYNGWIDMFGWGTSGWNSGAKEYQPYSTSTTDADYYPGNTYSNDLTGPYMNADWGIYNAIYNGGNKTGLWRTLTQDEWLYLYSNRANADSKHAYATINGIGGYILLPDNWILPNGLTFDASGTNATANQYTKEQWKLMEQNGAVFLPAAGYRDGSEAKGVLKLGDYWLSTSYDAANACRVFFKSDRSPESYPCELRHYGFSVRLVGPAPSYKIAVNPSNDLMGSTSGSGTYNYGESVQISANPNDCFHFTQWSDGNTDNPRTIIVNGDATYTAEFTPVQYTIKVESADESQGAVGVELVSTVGKEKDRIYYTSSDGNIVTPYSATVFGANIVCNTYQDGQGVIIFDSSVTSIGESAFWNCKSLTSITIPNSVTSIGYAAFERCSSLTSINVDASNPNYSSIDGVLFNKAKTTLIQYAIGNARTEYTIPNSVTSIGKYAFKGCKSLTSITIPNSVTSIGASAFEFCSSLTSITIPNRVTSIGNDAFYGCYSLTSVTIPNSVTSIGASAFHECYSLISVIIPNSVTCIGDFAFTTCESLTSITIPNSVTSIGEAAFEDCSSLTSITIPNSVTSIGIGAFQHCESLTSVAFEGSTPPVFGYNVFYNTNNCPIYVPYGTKDAYVTALNVNNTIDASRVIEK